MQEDLAVALAAGVEAATEEAEVEADAELELVLVFIALLIDCAPAPGCSRVGGPELSPPVGNIGS